MIILFPTSKFENFSYLMLKEFLPICEVFCTLTTARALIAHFYVLGWIFDVSYENKFRFNTKLDEACDEE